jgi:hypothetical protein
MNQHSIHQLQLQQQQAAVAAAVQPDIADLLQLSQQDAAQEAAAQHLLNEMMGLNASVGGDSNMESILEIMAHHEQQKAAVQHQQEQHQQELMDQHMEQLSPQLPDRPDKHYMTIADDGE